MAYGPKKRSQLDKLSDALFEIHMARPTIVANLTAPELCDRKGITLDRYRKKVAEALLDRQAAMSVSL